MGRRNRAAVEGHQEFENGDDGQEGGSARDTKRARQQDKLEFRPGTIKKIKVHNFMTYAGTVTITPGPRLNLVLGPNGTGKSSLVCALCVGLGGSTKLLGRADNLADYVRRNCSSAWTEITLTGNDGESDVVIRREIDVTYTTDDSGERKRGFKSKFFMNRRETSANDVKSTVAKFNIQFDNLCQFLPQDKVVEFARMDAYELLVATEKALGDSKLYTTHMELIQDCKVVQDVQQAVTREQNALKTANEAHDRRRHEYEKYVKYKELQEEAETIEKKLLWLDYRDARDEHAQCKDLSKEQQEIVNQLQEEQKQDSAPIRRLEGVLGGARQKLDACKRAYQEAARKEQGLGEKIDTAQQDVQGLVDQQNGLKKASEQLAKELDSLRQQVAKVEQQLAALPDGLPQELQERHQGFVNEGHALEAHKRELQEQMHEIADKQAQAERDLSGVQARLQQLNDVRYQRLMKCEQKSRGIRQVAEWLQQEKAGGRFDGPVYGPVCLEVNMRAGDRLWPQYFEQACGGHLNNFVCSTRNDEQKISSFIQQNNLRFTVACVTRDVSKPVEHPIGLPQQFEQYGITHTLDQLFDAPPLVKHMLVDLSGINKIYVGTQETHRLQKELFSSTGIRTVFVPTGLLSYSRSRYNQASVSVTESGLRECFLMGGPSAGDIEQELAQANEAKEARVNELRNLKAQNMDLHRAQQEANIKLERCKKGIDEISARKQEILHNKQKVKVQLTTLNAKLRAKEQQPDPLQQEAGLKAQLKTVVDKLVKLSQGRVAALKDMWGRLQQQAELDLQVKESEAVLEALKQQQNSRQGELARAQTQLEKARRLCEAAQQRKEAARQRAESDAPLSPELKAKMEQLPEGREELGARRGEVEREMARSACHDEGLVARFEREQRDIDERTKLLERQVRELGKKKGELDQKKDSWLPELKDLVGVINERFARNFEEIGCAGEVVLKEDPDYEKFALEIRVKFRESEELQPLTHNRQSGGERSVSTILYLIALQAVTETPFRVVDEINQGMDQVNERKVFIQLVESSCKPDTPQCFLLTPKLLGGLPFTPEITVLNIMNGMYIDEEAIPKDNVPLAVAFFGNKANQLVDAAA